MTLNEIFPVLVLYRCSLTDSVSYQSLIAPNAFSAFMVYDNSPSHYIVAEHQLPPTAHYYRDVNNGGLSKAYNHAAQTAQALGYRYLLLLDQDTFFPSRALQCYLEAPEGVKICAPILRTTHDQPFSPVDVCAWHLRGLHLSPQAYYPLQKYNPVNSGICIDIESFLQVGGYKEQVRLDYADFCFLRRLRRAVSSFYLLPFVARQDFSNDEIQVSKLLQRLRLYLESAVHCSDFTSIEKLRFHYQVFRHCLAIAFKSKSLLPLRLYLTLFLFHSR